MKKCDTCGKDFESNSYPVYDENYNLQEGLIQCKECFSPEVEHEFFCFKCGNRLIEESLGLIWCKSCKKHLLPFVSDGLQSLSIQN